LERSIERLRAEFIPKIKQFFTFDGASSHASMPTRRLAFVSSRPTLPCKAVAIGVSTGGPNALAELLPLFQSPFPLPIFIVQHMPPIFTRMLAERLQTLTELRVQEASMGTPIEAGNIYLAPGDYHMRVVKAGAREILKLDQAGQENSCRPAVDVLFRSVADVYGGSVVAVVLTGMGQDGLRGVERLRAEGAYIIAQDEASSVVWGMPGAIVHAGLADSIVSLRSIVPEIQNCIIDTRTPKCRVS
jgi:two-component system chemotaxis response regulator CheB